MEIQIMKLSDLKPADYNPRIDLESGMEEYEKLKQSILEFGFVDPPIFNKRTGNLVGGHQRVAVAKDLGLCEEIEVSVVDLPLDKEKALNVALNKISGRWDDDKLALLLKELDADILDLSGFGEDEIQDVIEQYDMRLDMENEKFDLDYEIEKAMEQAESIDEYKKIIRVALGKWLKNLQSGQIKLDKVSDLKILIEADLMLKDIEK